ncbi:MAG: response regulator [Gemmataceae bacterium]
MSFLDRLFRVFGRLRLWQQFALLGLFMVTFPIGLTARSFLKDGSRILTEHEIIDLADEANLRVTEFRDEVDAVSQRMARTGREVSRQLTGAGPRPDPLTPAVATAALTGVVHQWSAAPLPAGQPANSVAQLRHRYFADALELAVAVRVAPGQPASVTAAVVPPGRAAADARPDGGAAVRATLDDLAARVTREDAGYVSKLVPEPGGDGKPPRCLVAVGRPARWEAGKPTDVLAVVLDFGRYLEARSRVSPRHQFLVADPAGNLLFHPNPGTTAAGGPVAGVAGWEFPSDAWAAPGEPPADRDRRAAAVLQQGGLRLDGKPAPALRFFYRKGEFDGSPGKRMEGVLKDAAAKAAELNALLAEEARAAGGLVFRYGEVQPSSPYIEISHRDEKELARIGKRVDDWWRAAGGREVSWSAPLECKTFQGQLTYLRLDGGADDEPARLITAAALEELREDIETQFWLNVWRVVLPTVLVASLLTSLVVLVLTGSLRRLAASAQKAADPAAPVVLHGGGCLEVTLLAKALREMANRLRTDAARYSAILRAAGEGIVVASGEGAIEEANRAAAKMFGYPKPEDLVGKRVGSLIIENLPGGTGAALAAYAAEQEGTSGGVSRATPFGDAVRGRRADGTTFWLEVTLRPVNLKDRQLVTCVFRDVSQRKQAEEDIRRMNEELDTRVKVRTAELAEANTKLEVALRHAEAAAKAKDAFVANMSHELRQPLHIIIGFTEALKEEAEDTGTASVVPDLNKILTAAKHLLDLINDILDLAKIAAGKMELAVGPCDVNRLVDDVRLLVGPLAEKNANAFVVDAPAGLGQMVTDDRRVKQMLINLLSNAFKFTTGGTVRLVVRRATEGGRGWVRFAVADNGKGMTPEQVKQLGKQFYQADASTTRDQGGTGLGLSICQAFNDLLGGRPMRVTSTPGQGSEFVLVLPADTTAPADGGRIPPPSAEAVRSWVTAGVPDGGTASTWTWSPDKSAGTAPRGTVLVIDDDPMVRELMARFLTKEGFRVRTADSGPVGLALARAEKPAAITLDVMMPGTDGWQVLADLKADPATCDIPVVMLTIVDDRGRGYALGAADYLTKPIDWPRLGAILRRYQPPGGPKPVLVVDDDPHCRELVRRHLESAGYRVTEAADGEQGLREAAREAPALILLDLMMPNVDGFAFLDEFPKRFPGVRVPVLVLTAKDLTAADHDRLSGRVASILEKGDLSRLDDLVGLIRRLAKRATAPTG